MRQKGAPSLSYGRYQRLSRMQWQKDPRARRFFCRGQYPLFDMHARPLTSHIMFLMHHFFPSLRWSILSILDRTDRHADTLTS